MTESEIKLYSCSSFFLLVYPTAAAASVAPATAVLVADAERRASATAQDVLVLAERAGAAAPAVADGAPRAEATAAYWSKRLKCNIRYLTCGEQFLFLDAREKESETPVRILSETGILGYIIPCKLFGITAHLEK
jgi:hypothetical protein